MRFRLGCEIDYDILSPSTLIFNVEAMRGGRQHIDGEKLDLSPMAPVDTHIDPASGNRYRRVLADTGELSIRYEAEVTLSAIHDDPGGLEEVPVSTVPLQTLPFLNPSRYCPSDRLARFANREFGSIQRGHSRVTAICNWIYERVDYVSGASNTLTTAADTFTSRAGVCRDFAHLGITLCRALGIPARFVSCYAWQLDPPDFHAVFEAFIGDKWYLFDPTRKAALDGMVRIGCGRDAADTAFATIYGQVNSRPMSIWIERIDGVAADTSDWTTEAVSLALP